MGQYLVSGKVLDSFREHTSEIGVPVGNSDIKGECFSWKYFLL